MSEGTTIDTLLIDIKSTSTDASAGIESLAVALSKLKANGSVGVAVKNLEKLSGALKQLNSVQSVSTQLIGLANGMQSLKAVGSVTNIANSISKLGEAMSTIKGMDLGGLDTKFESIANAASKLSGVKAGGLASMVNALAKIKDVVEALDDDTIARFADKVRELTEKLTPLSTKMTTISEGFKAMDRHARSAGGGMKEFGSKVNVTRLNLANLVTVVQGAISVLTPLVRLFSSTISEAIEWDGIAARFGRGFGDQADEIYSWIQRLNQEMGINVQQFMQYSSVYATMLTGFGVGIKDAGKMALGYTELTYDIWAGYNDVYKNFADAAEAVKSAIAGEVEPVRRAGFTIVESTLEQTAANHGLEISLEKATEAQKSYLRYLTLVDQAHAQGLVGTYARELNTAEGLMRTFAQQLKSLAQAFGSLFLPILVRVMPWLQAFVNLLTEAIHRVAAFFGIEIQPVTWGDSNALGNIAGSADEATDSLDGTADAVDKTTDALKDLKKATIGIDELNVISPPTPNKGSDAGGVGGGLGAFEDLGVDSLWDESIFNQIQFEVDKIKSILKEALTSITAIIGGFMLAIGTILVVSGANIPLGLALMAAGAVTLVGVIAQNWNSMSDQLAKTLTIVTSVLGGFLLAIGAFLAFSGVNVGLGIALMAAGAISLATAATINWKFLNGDMKNALSILTGIISGALLAMGALFAFTGVGVGLGISLMVAGAVGLATTVALNWDSMPTKLKKVIADLTTIVSTAAIAIGAVLAFSGANVPMGMALMAAGAIGLVAVEQLNWDSTSGEVRRTLNILTKIVSSAALGVGAILAFSGVNIPLGIALMSAGAVGLASGANINWNYIIEKVKTVLKEIGIAAGASLIALGVLLVCTGVGVPVGLALIAAGAASLVTAVALNWDSIVSSVKKALGKVETEWNKLVKKIKEFDYIGVAVGLVKKGWTTVKGWIGSIPGVSQAVSLAKKGWSSVKGWIGSIPTLSAGIKLVKSGWTTVKKWLGSLNFDIGFKLPKIGINWGTKEVLGFKISYPKSFYTYAKGGFPDMGEMFIAREAGPEMVGKIGNKTTVANNQQIVEAVSEGVYSAMMAAMRQSEGNGGQAVNVYLDGRQLSSSIEKRQRERGATIMRNGVYAY